MSELKKGHLIAVKDGKIKRIVTAGDVGFDSITDASGRKWVREEIIGCAFRNGEPVHEDSPAHVGRTNIEKLAGITYEIIEIIWPELKPANIEQTESGRA